MSGGTLSSARAQLDHIIGIVSDAGLLATMQHDGEQPDPALVGLLNAGSRLYQSGSGNEELIARRVHQVDAFEELCGGPVVDDLDDAAELLAAIVQTSEVRHEHSAELFDRCSLGELRFDSPGETVRSLAILRLTAAVCRYEASSQPAGLLFADAHQRVLAVLADHDPDWGTPNSRDVLASRVVCDQLRRGEIDASPRQLGAAWEAATKTLASALEAATAGTGTQV